MDSDAVLARLEAAMRAPVMVHRIGRWWSPETRTLPHPADLIDASADPSLRMRIGRYLDGAEDSLVHSYWGTSWCRLGCEGGFGSTERCDGTWQWPAGLSHYVVEHAVRLPDEFLAHVRANAYAAPRFDGFPQPSDDFWHAWSARMPHRERDRIRIADAAQRLQRFRSGLQRARQHILELESKLGVSDQRCAWAGCDGHALSGMAICARCSLGRSFSTPAAARAHAPR